MSSNSPDSFTLFPCLPTELRLLIWFFYFDSPRIHVLYDADEANADPDRILLACTTLDAQTNIPVSPRIRTDISQEAREVALQSMRSRERVWTLTEPVKYKSLFGWRRRLPLGASPQQQQHPGQQAVDVDWDGDLLYCCSPASFYPFMILALRDWACKVRRMAVALPWETPRLPEQISRGGIRGMHLNGEYLNDAVRELKGLTEVSVVMLPPSEPTNSSDEATAGPSIGKTRATKQAQRSSFGFVKFVDYIKHVGKGAIGVASFDMTRISLVLETQLERLGRQSTVTVTRMVDMDFCGLQDAGYQRRRRGISRPGGPDTPGDGL